MEPRSEQFVIDGPGAVALHALHWGSASRQILVLLHGGGANAHWWDHLGPALADSFHVVALDFRGHGASDHPDRLEAGAFNNDLEALLEHLGTDSVVLLGHSMGAHVALDHAARHPATRRLVLIEASRGADRRIRRSARLALTFRRTYRTRQEAVDRYRFLPAAKLADESLRASIARHSVRREPDGRYGFNFDPRWFALPPRPQPVLSAVACAALLVRGEKSELLTREGADALVAALPDGRLAEIEGAGHHAQLDRPAAVLAAVQRFLAPVADSDP